jgi:hypothetical protein
MGKPFIKVQTSEPNMSIIVEIVGPILIQLPELFIIRMGGDL